MKNRLFIRALLLPVIFIAITAFMMPLPQEKNNYNGEKFTSLGIAVKSKVYIQQGSSYKVDIQADDKTLEKILVELNSEELQIRCKPGSKIDEPVTINITAAVLNAISVAGSAEVFVEKPFDTDKMNLSIAGSGSMTLNDLQTEKVSASIAGSGDLVLAGGKGESSLDVSIAGSGDIDALGFKATKAEVEIAGSGDCKLSASGKLDVSIAGSGDVYYKGNPILNSESAGSGKVSHLDD